ncbi:MAG: tellurite resistance TerB family protein [Bacteroidota bacterium]|nr:tellurite resistance TerB family protein [Bacteroidota bacterium]
MGFFDSLLKVSTPEIKSEKEAYAAIIYSCMAIDGEISEEEVHDLIEMVAHNKMFKGSNINDIFKNIASNYKAAGSFEKMVEIAMPLISNEKKDKLFVTAVDVVLSDGVVAAKEKDLIERLKTGLNIPDDFASKTIEVLLVKNKE